MKKVIAGFMALAASALSLTGCTDNGAYVASENLSTAADNFELDRRIVFVNGITDKYLMTVEGRCSIKADGVDRQLEVTCKTGNNSYKKHFLGLSDNVTYFVEQTQSANASEYRYRVVFRPETIIPDPEIKTSVGSVG